MFSFLILNTEPVWAVGFALEQTLRDATLAVFSFLILNTEPVWAVGFALEQTLHVVTLTVFSFLILKRLQHSFSILKNKLILLWSY
ncbi:MAG: hypothetical protein LBH59_07020 [Planctomycetaceae bacterium]|nr:hypothetical protein [Planctomycetaceae bacterium]